MEWTANGCRIHYTCSEQRDKKVLLLHGWGCTEAMMTPVAGALQDSMQTMTLDFPGFGQSDQPPEPWDVPAYTKAVEELLEHEHFFPFSVIAHSFGARVAICMAAHAGNRIERMVLTGAAGLRKPQTEEGRKRAERFQEAKKAISLMRKTHLFGGIPDQLEARFRQKYGSADYNALGEEMRKTFVKVVNQDLQPMLSSIECPVLLVFGDQDTETPLWMGQKMEKEIPDAGLAVFEGGTHFAYLEQLPRFNAVVRHFLLEMNV